MRSIKGTISRNRELLAFMGANYLDKGLVFLLPLVVLYLVKDRQTYNDIEYIYSIANVLLPFFCILSSYSFYGHKESNAKDIYIKEYHAVCKRTIVYLIASIIILVVLSSCLPVGLTLSMSVFIGIRLVYLIYVQYYSNYYRLINKPISIVYQTLTCSVVSILFLLVCNLFSIKLFLFCVFAPQFFILYKVILLPRYNVSSTKYYAFIKDALFYSLSLIINSTIVAFVMNYGKIYAYNYLSEVEMFDFSYSMRITMVITLANGTLISFWAKEIYEHGYTLSVIVKYCTLIGAAFAVAIALLMLLKWFSISQSLKFDLSVVFILLYTLLYCFSSFCEIYFGRRRKNNIILCSSTISCGVFLALVFLVGVKSLSNLSLYMFIYSFVYFLILIIIIKYFNEKEKDKVAYSINNSSDAFQ